MKGIAAIASMLALGLSAPAGVAVAQVYQCEVDGQRVFSQIPCAPDAESVEIRPTPARPGVSESGLRPGERAMLERHTERQAERVEREREAAAAHGAEQARRTRIDQAIRAREITPGMVPADVRRSWGEPAEILSGIDEWGSWQRWEYIRGPGGPRQYVRFREGEVRGASSWPR